MQGRQRTAAENNDNTAALRGKGKAIANPDSGPDENGGSEDDAYRGVSMANGFVNGYLGKSKDKGKGKGKGKAPLMDGFVDTEDEDLYS